MGNRLLATGHPRTKRLSSLTGLEVKQFFSTSGRGRSIFLDIPLYRTGDFAQNRVVSVTAILRQLPGGRAALRSLLFLKRHSPLEAIGRKRFISVRKVRP